MRPSDLRTHHLEAGRWCRWPGCPEVASQLAHLQHRGMGGGPAANTIENTTILCVLHHDLLDGRQITERARWVGRLVAALPRTSGVWSCDWPGCDTRPLSAGAPWCDAHTQLLQRIEERKHAIPHVRRELRALLKGVL